MSHSRDFQAMDGATRYFSVATAKTLPLVGVPEFGQINRVSVVRNPLTGGTPGVDDVKWRLYTRHPSEDDSGPDTHYDLFGLDTLGGAAAVARREFEREYALHDDRGEPGFVTYTIAAPPADTETLVVDGMTYTFRALAANVTSFYDVLIGTADATWTSLATKVELLAGATRLEYAPGTATFLLGGRANQSQKYQYDTQFTQEWTGVMIARAAGVTGATSLGPPSPIPRQDEKVLWVAFDAAILTNEVGIMVSITDLAHVGEFGGIRG